MSRTGTFILLGGSLGLVVGVMVVAAFLFGRSLFTITNSQTSFETPPVVVVATPTIASGLPTATNTVEPTGQAASTSTAPATQSVSTAVSGDNIVVSTTSVEYIQALSDLNIRSGPGTGYSIVGYLAGGQYAKVTGVHSASGWWRVICPDNTIGSCWVTGSPQFSKPENLSTLPTATPTKSPTTSGCTDIAALVADVTVPDNTQFAPNTGFNKTWRLKNIGTCIWSNNYQIVHAGGHLLGAISTSFALNQTVSPGQTADITISMVSPDTANNYQSDWKLQNPQGRIFGLGANAAPFFVKIVVTSPSANTTIAGLIYQDWNENGIYDRGETLMGSREVWLIPGNACHVTQEVVAAVAYSGADGVYTFKGNYSGNYCVGLAGGDGLDDVLPVTVSPGQVITGINLRSLVPSSSVSGVVWNDFCRLSGSSSEPEGNCVPDGFGGFRADGMIEPSEVNISGVTVLLHGGACGNSASVPVAAVTDNTGRYTFSSLIPGTYCVYVEATLPSNQNILLPGAMTFPGVNIWYQQLTLVANENAYAVNFGWDYQFN